MTTQEKGNGVDLYTWATPNGRKVSIMLEELELPYSVFPIDITKGEQHVEEFVALSPNNKIPAIVDHENGIRLMESGAILMYLAHKTGKLMSPIGRKILERNGMVNASDGKHWSDAWSNTSLCKI